MPEVKDVLENGKVDVLLTLPWFGNEASYYLAHKYNASLGKKIFYKPEELMVSLEHP